MMKIMNVSTFIKESRICKLPHYLQFEQMQKKKKKKSILFIYFTGFHVDDIYSQCKKYECCRNPHAVKALLKSTLS